MYDATVFQKIRRLKPSGRGELEITDVNNFYIDEGKLTYEVLDGWWTDAGHVRVLVARQQLWSPKREPTKCRGEVAQRKCAR